MERGEEADWVRGSKHTDPRGRGRVHEAKGGKFEGEMEAGDENSQDVWAAMAVVADGGEWKLPASRDLWRAVPKKLEKGLGDREREETLEQGSMNSPQLLWWIYSLSALSNVNREIWLVLSSILIEDSFLIYKILYLYFYEFYINVILLPP